MSYIVQGLVVAGVGSAIVACCKYIEVGQMRQDLEKLRWLDKNVDLIRPVATRKERDTLAAELHMQQKALEMYWPRRKQRIQWEDLPIDERFRDYFSNWA